MIWLILVGKIVAALAVIGAAAAFFPNLWRFIRGAARVPVILDSVAREFSPNGGGSLRDSIDNLATATSGIKEAFNSHLERDTEFEAYVHKRFHDTLNEHQKLWLLLTMTPSEREQFAKELMQRRRVDDPEMGTT